MYVVNKKAMIKMLAGTVARGILWGCSVLGTYFGIASIEESTANSLAYFIVSAVIAAGSTIWSNRKDNTLAAADPKARL